MTRHSVSETSLNTILELIGKKLLELRVKKGYTSHADFAADYNLPRIQYWRMEKGRTNITLKSLNKILSIHNISMEEFFVMALRDQKKS